MTLGLPDVSWVTVALSLAPIVLVLVTMVILGWGADRSGPAALVLALTIATVGFGADTQLLALSQGKAVLLSVWVLSIIWAALFLYNIVNESGGIAAIGHGLARISADRPFQVLLLAWVFTSFLQGIAGYGVPVAVVAPLMVGLGFAPATAVVITSIGHSWSVTFGSLAASFFVLVGASGIPGSSLSFDTSVLLGATCLLCGGGALYAFGGLRGLRAGLPLLVVAGTLMAATQMLVAHLGAYALAAFAAGCVGLLAMGLMSRLPRYRPSASRRDDSDLHHRNDSSADQPVVETVSVRAFARAFSAYGLLVVIVLATSLSDGISEVLHAIRLSLPFPATSTSFGWTNAATDSYRSISLFGDTGSLLLYAAAGGYVVYRITGQASAGTLRRATERTVRSALAPSIGIIAMVGMALAMTDSGMTLLLAHALVDVTGPTFPLAAPLVGVLGAFMTGSNTNSNILFASLQRDAALLLAVPPSLLLAAQTTGGALGSMLAPAKVILGCSAVGLGGKEGPVMRRGVLYGLGITLVIGATTLVWSLLA